MLSNGIGDAKGSPDVVSSKDMSDAFRGSGMQMDVKGFSLSGTFQRDPTDNTGGVMVGPK